MIKLLKIKFVNRITNKEIIKKKFEKREQWNNLNKINNQEEFK